MWQQDRSVIYSLRNRTSLNNLCQEKTMKRSAALLAFITLLFILFPADNPEAAQHYFQCDLGYWLTSTTASDWEWESTYYSTGYQIPAGTYSLYRGLEDESFSSYLLRLSGIYEYSSQYYLYYGLEYIMLDIGLRTNASIWDHDQDSTWQIELIDRQEGPLNVINLLVGMDYCFQDVDETWRPFIGFYFTVGRLIDDLDDGYWSKITELPNPNPQYFIIPCAGVYYRLSPDTQMRFSLQYRLNTSGNYSLDGIACEIGLRWKLM